MTPADDALARLGRQMKLIPYASVDLATVRDELQRLRDERDEYDRYGGQLWKHKAEAAEAEVQRLTNKLNEDSQNFEIECLKAERDRLEYRAEAAEAEVQRLTEGLRRVADALDAGQESDARGIARALPR